MPTKHLDTELLKTGFARWLTHTRGVSDILISEPVFPTGGFASEIAMIDVTWQENTDVKSSSWVIRMAPESSSGIHSNYSLIAQDASLRLAATTGVVLAQPFTTETDPQWLGTPFMVMPKIEGHVIGGAAAFDPWLMQLDSAAQRLISEHFIDIVATVHSADITSACAKDIPARDNAADLDYWSNYLMWSSASAPDQVLSDSLAWCVANKPRIDPAPVLLWGDVRYGNVIYGDDYAPKAVLDWDMSTIGPAEHDLAWFFAQEDMTIKLTRKKVPGFPDRHQLLDRYQQKTGRQLQDLYWYETFALFRGAALLTLIDSLRRQAGEQPMFASPGANPLYQELLQRIGAG